jgi:hypothetical protein
MHIITINVPVVYVARDVMILMRENPFRGPLEGVGPENRDFLGLDMASSKARGGGRAPLPHPPDTVS